MKQGREARACQETAERLREPESGTAADDGRAAAHGASSEDAVEGAENLVGVGAGPRGSAGRQDVKTLEGIDSKGT
jgi:hypothetical protein